MRSHPHSTLAESTPPGLVPKVLLLPLAALLAACGGGASRTPTGDALAITAQPDDQSVVEGATATFTVSASGAEAFQWQRSVDGGATYGDLAAATAESYTTPPATLDDGGTLFRVRVTGALGSVTSGSAVLTVRPRPSIRITTEPPLPAGNARAAYTHAFTASGGTLPLTWSSPGLPQGFALDPVTGVLTGTPALAGSYAIEVSVQDGSTPPLSDTRVFELFVLDFCDQGNGSLAVTNAPSTVEAAVCPGVAGPAGPPDVADRVTATWQEVFPYGGGSYFEGLGVTYYRATGVVDSITYYLSDPTRSIMWICSSSELAPPPCTGAAVDVFNRTVAFSATQLGQLGDGQNPIALEGVLRIRTE